MKSRKWMKRNLILWDTRQFETIPYLKFNRSSRSPHIKEILQWSWRSWSWSVTDDTQEMAVITTATDIAAETHLHARHDSKANLAFLPAHGEASSLLLPSSVSLLYNQKTSFPLSSRWKVSKRKPTKVKNKIIRSYRQRLPP